MQRQVILKLAEKPCVIVGRGADYILRDRDDVFDVFIHASMENRADRIVRLYGESEKSQNSALPIRIKNAKFTISTIPTANGATQKITICALIRAE